MSNKKPWFGQPMTDSCIECHQEVNKYADRHYIIWDAKNQVFRRIHADCKVKKEKAAA